MLAAADGPDGSKLGKTTGARVWLDPARTSPYELYQHFIQTDDRQVRQLLAWLTLLPVAEIDRAVAEHDVAPERRQAQRLLAREVTAIVHGRAAAEQAEQGGRVFGDGLDPDVLRELETTMPTTALSEADFPIRGRRSAGPDGFAALEECRCPADPPGWGVLQRPGRRLAGGGGRAGRPHRRPLAPRPGGEAASPSGRGTWLTLRSRVCSVSIRL